MEFTGFVIKFLILTAVVSGVIIFFLHRTLIASTEGAVNRLNAEIAKANARQEELNRKIKEADEELARRQQEARELAQKMSADAETNSKAEREKIIAEARQESEGIILKAQGMKDLIRKELEKESKIKVVRTSVDILNKVFSDKAKDALNDTLVLEFLNNLKETDMSRISVDICEVEIVTAASLSADHKSKFSTLLKDKLKREVSLKESVDPNIGGGASLRFGSMALDGSIRNLILEESGRLLQKVEIES